MWACGGATSNIPDASPPDDASTGGDDSSMMMSDVTTDPDTGMNCKGCSGDLHDVVECMGNVLMTCAKDQACAPGGVCQPACDAARAQKSSIGCDYYAVNPGAFQQFSGQTHLPQRLHWWNDARTSSTAARSASSCALPPTARWMS